MSGRTNLDWNAVFLLIRPLNLLFIGVTQYLLLFHYLFPILRTAGAPVLLEGWRAFVFLLTTTAMTGAGYAINDLYDVETDRINKPGKWLVGKRISHRAAVVITVMLLLSGGILAVWLAIDIQRPVFWLIYPAGCFVLWAYSRYLKGIPLAGNILVAVLCSLVGGIVWFAEREGIGMLWEKEPQLALRMLRGLGFYLFFAFLSTLFREIVKDCEDLHGDAAASHRTLPVRLGLRQARLWGLGAGLVLEAGLAFITLYFLRNHNPWGAAFSIFLLAVPLAAGLVPLTRATAPEHFRKVSRIAKWVIFAGVFLILFLP